MPPCTIFEDFDDVPDAKSSFSTSAVLRPRLAASSATPAPVTPPPMTSTSNSSSARRRSASSRRKGCTGPACHIRAAAIPGRRRHRSVVRTQASGCPRWSSELMEHVRPVGSAPRVVVEIGIRAGRADRGPRRSRPGEFGDWPWPGPEPVHILTAWDPGSCDRAWRRTVASRRASRRTSALWRRRCGPPAARTRHRGARRGRGRTRARRGRRPRPGGPLRPGRDLLVVARTSGPSLPVRARRVALGGPWGPGGSPRRAARAASGCRKPLDLENAEILQRPLERADALRGNASGSVLARCESATHVGCEEAARRVALRGGRGTWSSATTVGRPGGRLRITARPGDAGVGPGELYRRLISDEEGRRYWSESAWTHEVGDGTGRRVARSSRPGAPRRSSATRCGSRSCGSDASAGS